MIEIGIENERR